MEIIEKKSSPEWLEPWLRLPFFTEKYKCKKHVKKYNSVYCGVCMEEPICEICWEHKKSREHQGHQILQVCTASRRAAIPIERISEFLDISDIQLYSINGNDVVFLNPHEKGVRNAHRKPNCERCNRRLMADKYRFCSIKCKNYKSEECDAKQEKNSEAEMQRRPTHKRQMMLKRKMMSSECFSLRKRSRKGIPQRSPLQ